MIYYNVQVVYCKWYTVIYNTIPVCPLILITSLKVVASQMWSSPDSDPKNKWSPFHTIQLDGRTEYSITLKLEQLSWWLQHTYWNTSGDFLNRISHRDARSNILTTPSPPQVHNLLPSIEREKVPEYQPERVIVHNCKALTSFPSPCLAMLNLGMRLCVCHSNWRVKLYCGSCDCGSTWTILRLMLEDSPLTCKTARMWVGK